MAEKPDHGPHDLTFLLSIFPIREAIVSRLLSGDLIRLARLNTSLRSVLRSFSDDDIDLQTRHTIHIGQQYTPSWKHLFSLATHECSALNHKPTKPDAATKNPIHPCKHCAMPTCETCIIRTSLAKGNSETLAPYRTRTRYLCPTCWTEGKLRRDFRYPTQGPNRELVWEGRGYGMRGGWCSCTVKKDQWVCGECRDFQGQTFLSNEVPTSSGVERAVKDKPSSVQFDEVGRKAVRCYGSGCSNMIMEPDRDRRRICIWCSRPLARQFGGEERMKWDAKVRAINAVSRSADIEEWARNRFRILTMSRRQMRGTAACMAFDAEAQDHDLPIFVRHFDAINYRAFILDHTPGAVPDPESVWRSKSGKWVYQRRFLKLMGQAVVTHCAVKGEQPWGRVDPAYLRQATGAGTPSSANLETNDTPVPRRRTNAELRREIRAARKAYEQTTFDLNDIDDLVQRRVHLSDLMASNLDAYSSALGQQTQPDYQYSGLSADIQTSIIKGNLLASQTGQGDSYAYSKLEGAGRILDEPGRVQTIPRASIPSSSRRTESESASAATLPHTGTSGHVPEPDDPAETEDEIDIEQTESPPGIADVVVEADTDQGDPPPYTP